MTEKVVLISEFASKCGRTPGVLIARKAVVMILQMIRLSKFSLRHHYEN